MAVKPETIDACRITVSATRRAALKKLRKTILSILPDAAECISYSMPALGYAGHLKARTASSLAASMKRRSERLATVGN